MKNSIFILLFLIIYVHNRSIGQNSIGSQKKSNSSWDSNIELDNGPNPIILENGSISTTGDVLIKGSIIQLSDFKINCHKITFGPLVTNVQIAGKTIIDAKFVDFSAGATINSEVTFTGLNTTSDKLTVNYSSDCANLRTLVFKVKDRGQIEFIKRKLNK